MHTVGKGKNAVLTEDWLTTTPKRGFDYIFSESGLDAEEGREFVNNKLAEAQKNLDKVKNGKPKMGTSIAAYKEAKEAYTTHVEDAQKAVDYWQSVKAEHDKVLLAERHARDEKIKLCTRKPWPRSNNACRMMHARPLNKPSWAAMP